MADSLETQTDRASVAEMERRRAVWWDAHAVVDSVETMGFEMAAVKVEIMAVLLVQIVGRCWDSLWAAGRDLTMVACWG